MADDTAETEVVETAPPAMNDSGFAMEGDYPANLRLRAEALAAEKVAEDPAGIVTPEHIAETGKRVEAEAKEAADNTPSLKWSAERLREHAEGMGLTVETDANKPAILKAITAADAAKEG